MTDPAVVDRLRGQLTAIEQNLTDLVPRDVATLLGDLERLRAVLWARLTVASTSAAPVPTAEEPADRLLTIPEVATRLGVPTAYAYELARRRQLPVLRVGLRYLRVPAAGLSTWIGERLDDPGSRRHSRGAVSKVGADAHVGVVRGSARVDRNSVHSERRDTALGPTRGSTTTRADRGGPPRDAREGRTD
jgi:excisionase family DNA binding protein